MTGHGSFRLLAHQIRHEHLPLVHRFPLRLDHRPHHDVNRLTLQVPALTKPARSHPIQVGQKVVQILAVVALVFGDHPHALAPLALRR